jgi:hypothetical protein
MLAVFWIAKAKLVARANRDLLELRFTEVVHGNVIRDAERIKTNVVSKVSLQVRGIRKERNSRALLGVQCSGFAGCRAEV